MANAKKTGQYCTLIQHSSNLYEIIFHAASYAAIEEWLAFVEATQAHLSPQEVVLYLIDSAGVENMPIFYVLRRSQEFVAAHPDRPRTRTAVLYSDNALWGLLGVLNVLTNWLRGSQREVAQFFPLAQREVALAWLREEK